MVVFSNLTTLVTVPFPTALPSLDGSSPGRSVLQRQFYSSSFCENSVSLHISAFNPLLLKVTGVFCDSCSKTLHDSKDSRL